MAEAQDVAQLLARAAAGDEAAVTELFTRYRKRLKQMVRLRLNRRLQGRIDESDTLQEAFLEAAKRLREYLAKKPLPFFLWLRQLAGTRLAKAHRHHLGTRGRDVRLERRLVDELEQSSRALCQELAARQSSPSQRVAARERAVRLAAALTALPPDYGDVIVLRHFEGLPFAGVAERLGRSQDSVKKLWARALGRLRVLMEDDEG